MIGPGAEGVGIIARAFRRDPLRPFQRPVSSVDKSVNFAYVGTNIIFIVVIQHFSPQHTQSLTHNSDTPQPALIHYTPYTHRSNHCLSNKIIINSPQRHLHVKKARLNTHASYKTCQTRQKHMALTIHHFRMVNQRLLPS